MTVAQDPGFSPQQMDGVAVGELARFWQPIEAAADSLATASRQRLPAALTNLVDLLAGDLIPRLRAEEKVLLPLVSTGLAPGGPTGLNCAAVGRLTETISTLAATLDVGRIHGIASTVLALLAGQREAEAALVERIQALPADLRPGPLGEQLEEEAQAARSSQFFVSDPERLPTEAWVLRHNPKATRIGSLAPGRPSPVADLVAVLESTL